MVKIVLALLFSFFTLLSFGQKGNGNCNGCGNSQNEEVNAFSNNGSLAFVKAESPKLSVYPNPAVDFINIQNDDSVGKIVLVNLVGREVKTFEAEKGKQYNVSDLANGMYLVQLYSTNKKLLTTQRLQKR